jgi:carbonic anhydrase
VVTQLKNLRPHPAVANRLLENNLSLHGWVITLVPAL